MSRNRLGSLKSKNEFGNTLEYEIEKRWLWTLQPKLSKRSDSKQTWSPINQFFYETVKANKRDQWRKAIRLRCRVSVSNRFWWIETANASEFRCERNWAIEPVSSAEKEVSKLVSRKPNSLVYFAKLSDGEARRSRSIWRRWMVIRVFTQARRRSSAASIAGPLWE